MAELYRLLRHLLAPAVIILVDRGYIPEAAQNDVLEALLIVVSFIVAYGASFFRDRRRAGTSSEDGER